MWVLQLFDIHHRPENPPIYYLQSRRGKVETTTNILECHHFSTSFAAQQLASQYIPEEYDYRIANFSRIVQTGQFPIFSDIY